MNVEPEGKCLTYIGTEGILIGGFPHLLDYILPNPCN